MSVIFIFHSPTLTWRDLQHIIVATSRPGNLLADDWIVNGADYRGNYSLYIDLDPLCNIGTFL